jgi:peptidyl-prolyl cis-trans isomerase SurA
MMYRNTLFTFFIAFLAMTFSAQAQDDAIVLTVEDEKVTVDDFEAIFRKNNRDSVVTKEALSDYMELFINFKLKVREAEELGLDTSANFRRELTGYRKQLSRPYLIDNELLDELIQEAYNRTRQEVRASHILIKVDRDAAPEDTLKAYNRIMELRKRIMNGEDFSTVATSKGGSEDPSVRDNSGDLGYFTAFQMVYPFESAAYKTSVGEVSMPIRTRFGYHLVKTTDKRDARGEIRAAHIMIRYKDKNDPDARNEAEQKAREIYEMLEEGADFAELAMRFSQDASTSRNGGELPWFGTGKMVEEFEDAAFALSEDGQISQPVESPYGWHIIKRLEYRPVPEFDAVEQQLRSKVSRDSRSDITKQSFITKLKKEYGVSPSTKVLKPIYKAAAEDSAFAGDNGITVKKMKKLNKELFSIDGKSYTAKDFYDYLNGKRIRKRDLSAEALINRELDAFIERELMDYEDSQLEKKYNDFRLLINEYHDGILLFELTDQKVWSKAVKDTTGLQAFYEANKNRFMWEERMSGTLYTCEDAATAKQVQRMLKRGMKPQEIKEALNDDSSLTLNYVSGTWELSDEEVLSKLPKEAGTHQVEHNGQVVVAEIEEVLPPQPKALNEARGMVTAEYQNHLEEEWIKELRAKYDYQVNREVLHTIK